MPVLGIRAAGLWAFEDGSEATPAVASKLEACFSKDH